MPKHMRQTLYKECNGKGMVIIVHGYTLDYIHIMVRQVNQAPSQDFIKGGSNACARKCARKFWGDLAHFN